MKSFVNSALVVVCVLLVVLAFQTFTGTSLSSRGGLHQFDVPLEPWHGTNRVLRVGEQLEFRPEYAEQALGRMRELLASLEGEELELVQRYRESLEKQYRGLAAGGVAPYRVVEVYELAVDPDTGDASLTIEAGEQADGRPASPPESYNYRYWCDRYHLGRQRKRGEPEELWVKSPMPVARPSVADPRPAYEMERVREYLDELEPLCEPVDSDTAGVSVKSVSRMEMHTRMAELRLPSVSYPRHFADIGSQALIIRAELEGGIVETLIRYELYGGTPCREYLIRADATGQWVGFEKREYFPLTDILYELEKTSWLSHSDDPELFTPERIFSTPTEAEEAVDYRSDEARFDPRQGIPGEPPK